MLLKRSLEVGLSFGLTSGIITTLGLIVGLNAGTSSKLVVIGGILTIAIADAFSDALGMHVSQESDTANSENQVWIATVSTFLAKLLVALTFLVPVSLLPLNTAAIASVMWGAALITFFCYFLAKQEHKDPLKVIGEHVLIAVAVVFISSLVGIWVRAYMS